MIIALAGPMGSGKDVAAKILIENFGLIPVSFGSFIRVTCICRGLKPTRENLQRIGDELRSEGALPEAIVIHSKLIESKNLDVVITDLRLLIEYEHLKRVGAKVIGIYAPKELRYERIRRRARAGDALTWEEFERLSRHPSEREAELISLRLADHTIFNISSIEKLEEEVITLAQRLGIEPRKPRIRTAATLIYEAMQLLDRPIEELKRMFFERKDPAAFLALLSIRLCIPPYLLIFDLI